MCMKKKSPMAKEVEKDFQKWFEDPLDPEPVAEAEQPKHRFGLRRIDIPQKLAEAFIFGSVGAIFFGAVVGLCLEFLSYWEIYRNDWSGKIVFIILAAVIGFFGGMSIGLSSRLRK